MGWKDYYWVALRLVGRDFLENIPWVTSFALAVGTSAGWLGHEASYESKHTITLPTSRSATQYSQSIMCNKNNNVILGNALQIPWFKYRINNVWIIDLPWSGCYDVSVAEDKLIHRHQLHLLFSLRHVRVPEKGIRRQRVPLLPSHPPQGGEAVQGTWSCCIFNSKRVFP